VKIKREAFNPMGTLWLIRHWFYLGILGFAWIQILMFPPEPRPLTRLIILGFGATLYSCFKVMHPLRWHEFRVLNVVLFSVDLSVCSGLVILSGGIHSPFILYTLAPVVTAAILLQRKYTFTIATVTYSYVVAAIFINLAPGSHATLAELNEHATYMLALGLTAVLPYLMNVREGQTLRLKAVLSERQRLAREIHDSLCQTIYGLRWQIQMLRSGMIQADQSLVDDEIESLLLKAEGDARNLIGSLRSFKSGCSLASELKSYLGRYEEEGGISYDLEEEGQNCDLDDLIKSEVLHICEEAVRNAVKHSGCRHIDVRLSSSNGYLKVILSDDGCGFESTGYVEGRGLMVMKERAESVGGRLNVRSFPPLGTEIQLEVPKKCSLDLVRISP